MPRELIDERTAHLLMNALALGLPVAGGVVGTSLALRAAGSR